MEDYDKWSTLVQEMIAPDGMWIAYTLKYDSGWDTLFIKHTATSRQYSFPKGRNAVFSGDSKWLTLHLQEGIVLLDLKTGKEKSFPNAIKTDFNVKSEYLVTCIKKEDTQQVLLFDLKKGTGQKVQDIKEYTISPDGKSMGFITHGNSVQVIRLGQNTPQTLMPPTNALRKHLVWNDTGNAIAFLEGFPAGESNEGNHKIYLIEQVDKNKKIQFFDPTVLKGSSAGIKIFYNLTFTPLLIAQKPTKVFFYINGESQKDNENGVEVWNSLDTVEYQRRRIGGSPSSQPKLAVWWPETGRVEVITTNQYPSVFLTPDRNKAIIFDQHQYEPQHDIIGPADLWLKDLNTGKTKLVLKKQSGYPGSLGVSPNSRYLNYYRENHWWVYDMDADKHTKITDTMNSFEDLTYKLGGTPPSYGLAGWSADSKSFIVYTRFDVWRIAADGTSQEKLTNGEASGKRYRVCTNLTSNLQTFYMYDFTVVDFDLNKGLVLKAFDEQTKASGYYRWTPKGKHTQMIFKNAQLSRIKKADQTDAFILIEEKADVPPKIVYIEGSKKEKVLVETNNHQKNFAWSKAELISYTNSKGVPLQGVLHYPAGYQPGKKYPMVVYVYEHQSNDFHKYHNPSLYNAAGFSPSNYTSDGYFVLYPDIVYTLGEPAYSAVDCVVAAVKNVLDKGMVDEKRIGLIGHSYGGYETSFIVTQTDMFAAAVAGAACTDLVAHALTLEEGTGRSQMWRYIAYQMRMGKSLYEDYEGYIENSPITYAANINTPLLSWSGKNDYQVDPQQSMALHMAMRSLNKPHTLVLYPDEQHVLLSSENQKDLTLMLKAWFDRYLKGVPFPKNSNLK